MTLMTAPQTLSQLLLLLNKKMKELIVVQRHLFKTFELYNQDIWQRREMDRFHCSVLMLTTFRTKPFLTGVQLHHRQRHFHTLL